MDLDSPSSSLLSPSEADVRTRCVSRALEQLPGGRKRILETPFPTDADTYVPLAILSDLLRELPGPWPVLNLLNTYAKAWKLLPEIAKAGRACPEATNLLDNTLQQCKRSYTSVLSLVHASSSAKAIIESTTGSSITHAELATAIAKFQLPVAPTLRGQKPVVAISLPNGRLLALTILATATYYTAAPVAHGSGVGPEQFKADILQSRARLVVCHPEDIDRLGLRDSWVLEAGIDVVLVTLSNGNGLKIYAIDQSPIALNALHRPIPNTADNTAILLFTSGTTGTKKLVPLTLHSLLSGTAMVVSSWGLSEQSRCLNQMPLHHVGGLVRNLFAPLLSGGSVICCAGFDANLFWDCVEDHSPTWYYASPSMHQAILDAVIDRPAAQAKSKIRLICNAAGALLPSLAAALLETFSTEGLPCTVLPSYGMTECMPISTPPMEYKLERTGTSGISVGPELCVLDTQQAPVKFPGIGRICVRGPPAFGGYQCGNGLVDRSSFNDNGWFDTGDVGYLDNEGFLYITGRSKEIINRGGEVISPFEVENAIVDAAAKSDTPISGRISGAVAFSVPHDVLQEVVGIALATPEGKPRPCLRTIHIAVKNTISNVKLPAVIVYMKGGLPLHNGKILRIGLARRLGLPMISDDTPQACRYFEATCPAPDTPLSTAIACRPLRTSYEPVIKAAETILPDQVEAFVRPDASGFYPELICAPRRDSEIAIDGKDITSCAHEISHKLDGYHTPSRVVRLDEPFPRDNLGRLHQEALSSLLESRKEGCKDREHMTMTERRLCALFAGILRLQESDLKGDSDFFDLGGNSMAAGRFIAALRSELDLRISIDVLFSNTRISSLGAVLDRKLEEKHQLDDQKRSGPAHDPTLIEYGCSETCSSSNPWLMLIQLVPIGLVYPMRRALTWTGFVFMMSATLSWPTTSSIPGRLLNLVMSLFVGRLATEILVPFIGIGFKWLLIGRYKQGLYPMWGLYHTRWWLTEKVVSICGKGVFDWFSSSRVVYLRLLGANIGKGVEIHEQAVLGEWDLISIGDNATLDECKVRPFSAERNTSMYLGRISIGTKASVGLCSFVAAGTSIPAGACIGPNSSSWEVYDSTDERNRDLASNRIPKSHWLLNVFLARPLILLTAFIGLLPWLAGLIPLVRIEPSPADGDDLRTIILWFSAPMRVGFHYVALAANSLLGPLFYFVGVLSLKWAFDGLYGKLGPGKVQQRSTVEKFRRNLYNELVPERRFRKATALFGGHYEFTSILARALGAKVGKRVYWPGNGPYIQDWDLLDLGDDVVFGSRSHIITSDGTGSAKVRIKSGVMVADRVVLLPGAELEEHCVMGSGALAQRDGTYPAASTWVGSIKGDSICLSGPSRRHIPDRGDGKTGMLSTYGPDESSASSSSSITTSPDKDYNSRTESDISEESPYPKKEPLSINDDDQNATRSPEVAASSPFGRAFYEGRAPYRVWSQFEIFIYSTIITVANGVYWNIGSISAVQVVGYLYRHSAYVNDRLLAPGSWWRPLMTYALILGVNITIFAMQSIIALCAIVAFKWILMGRRVPGSYDWDKSSYCQRWQLFLKLEMFRRNCYGGQGILGLLTGTAWIVLYFRALGARIGKDCALFASGFPSLMLTEPDLVTLEDRVAVDDASLVAHINTRGHFDLNPLFVGARSVLRSNSRLLSGARMEQDTCLLEHTLVMAGDNVDSGATAQGWPSQEFLQTRTPTLEPVTTWRVKPG